MSASYPASSELKTSRSLELAQQCSHTLLLSALFIALVMAFADLWDGQWLTCALALVAAGGIFILREHADTLCPEGNEDTARIARLLPPQLIAVTAWSAVTLVSLLRDNFNMVPAVLLGLACLGVLASLLLYTSSGRTTMALGMAAMFVPVVLVLIAWQLLMAVAFSLVELIAGRDLPFDNPTMVPMAKERVRKEVGRMVWTGNNADVLFGMLGHRDVIQTLGDAYVNQSDGTVLYIPCGATVIEYDSGAVEVDCAPSNSA